MISDLTSLKLLANFESGSSSNSFKLWTKFWQTLSELGDNFGSASRGLRAKFWNTSGKAFDGFGLALSLGRRFRKIRHQVMGSKGAAYGRTCWSPLK